MKEQKKRPRGRPPLPKATTTSSSSKKDDPQKSSNEPSKHPQIKNKSNNCNNSNNSNRKNQKKATKSNGGGRVTVPAPPLPNRIQSSSSATITAMFLPPPVLPLFVGTSGATPAAAAAIVAKNTITIERRTPAAYYDFPAKISKLSTAETTRRVVSILMTSDPLTYSEICERVAEEHSGYIDPVLEVLMAMGVVVPLRLNDSTVEPKLDHTPASASNEITNHVEGSSDISTEDIYYSLAGFAKLDTVVKLNEVHKEVERMLTIETETNQRIAALQELSGRDMPQSERRAAFKNLLYSFQEKDPQLREDPLYMAMYQFVDNPDYVPITDEMKSAIEEKAE